MMPEINEKGIVPPEGGEGEGVAIQDEVKLSKKEYEELIEGKATVGSLKRDLKDAQKALEDAKTTKTPEKTKPEEFGLLQKSFLRSAGITAEDEIELAKVTALKWGIEVDKLVDDEDFKIK